jgi:hypothetical protein
MKPRSLQTKHLDYCFFRSCSAVILFVLLFSSGTQAQFYSSGVDPSGVHWKQISDDRIRIVFPEGYEEQAITLLRYLKEVKLEAAQTLPARIPSISVVLHNQTSQANGFVTWAPKRMEMFTLADQNTYPQDWLKQLAIHEFRHVVQISNMRQGMTKVLSFLLGEQAVGAIIGLYIPTWFLEGDAVSFETAYTKVGRGRIPSFFIPYVSMLDKYGGFTYEKAIFGSYKHFVPDHYVVGYHLVSYSRFYFGERLWKSMLDRAARRPYSITPVSHTLKKWTGLPKFKWYQWSAQRIKSHYHEDVVLVEKVSKDFNTNQNGEDFVSYRYPHYLNDSTVVVEKSGLSYVKEWVTIDRQGKEQHLAFPGFYTISNTSVSDGKLYYTEYKFDKRWTHRLWADVKQLDLHTKRKKRITNKKYIYSPAARGQQLVYVEQNKSNRFELVVNTNSNIPMLHFDSPSNQMLFTPTWESDSTIICITLNKEKGKHFTRLNINTKQWTSLSQPVFYDINQPLVWNHYIIHKAAYESKEQVYAYDTLRDKHFRITRETYEATDPSILNDRLLFSSYTANGYVLKEQPLDTTEWIEITLANDHWDNAITSAMTKQEQKVKSVADSVAFSYTITKYSKITHLFNFHSWAPLYVDVDNATLNSGASVFSQNLLSTSFLSAGYLYDNTEQTGKWIMNYQYTGLYPVLSFNASIGDRFMKRYGNWKQFNFDIGIALPFNLTHGPYSEKLTLSFFPRWQSIYDVRENTGGLVNQDLINVSYRLDYSRLFRLAPRDLRPERGQAVFFEYRHAPVGDFSYASFLAGSVSTWFPSFWKHHSILAKVQGHHYEGGGRYLSSPIAFPRGYAYLFSQDLVRGSVDYAFPLFYPDWRITSLFYIKRIKANLFYDAAWASQNAGTAFYDSKGVDIRMDFHFANFLAPIDLGIRFYQLNNGNLVNYQVLLAYQLGK